MRTESHESGFSAFVATLRLLRSFLSKKIILVAALADVTGCSSRSLAASLELTDGRIVLTALGEKLVFREEDAGRVYFYWPGQQCDPRDKSGSSLARWIGDPKIGECFSHAIPDAVANGDRRSLYLKVLLSDADGRSLGLAQTSETQGAPGTEWPIYPGAIQSDELPNPPDLSGELIIRLRDAYIGLECLSPVEGPPDALGYLTLRAGKSPTSGLYALPPDRRAGNASRPLCVMCSSLSGCAVLLRSTDNAVSLALGWRTKDLRPQSTWKLYDAAARKIAASIFVARQSGHLQ